MPEKQNNRSLFAAVAPKLDALAKSNAVIGPVTSVGERHTVPLVELALSLGGGEGGGTGDDPETGLHGQGHGGAAAGGAKVTPVAVIVVEGGSARIESLGH